MAGSTTHLDEISSGQSSKEVTANALFDAMSANALFGRRASTTSALTWGYYGGVFQLPDLTLDTIANGTIALTASSTNYLYVDDAGVVTKVTSAPAGWPDTLADDAIALYEIVTGASSVTSYTDWRAPLRGPAGAAGGAADIAADVVAATGKTTPVDADLLPLVDSAASNVLKKLTWANLKTTLKTYFDTLYAPVSQPLLLGIIYPGAPTASALVSVLVAPAGITTLTFAAAIAGSSGKAFTAATAQTDFDVRKNATTSANGTSVGTIRFAAAATVPSFIAASGFTLTGGTDYLSVWAPATPDATLANIAASLYCTRS
jgi:hypothetical protein